MLRDLPLEQRAGPLLRRAALHLKRISLQGFKSFADPISLEPVVGVTAVVGPNGSGKSNVVEAIRWVLGEQSARRLRGYRMDDLIFAGSKKRRPVNLAQVTLLIDNEDGNLAVEQAEVALTRRVDREGAGEFYINRVPCRLRDIHDLFLDTGLGRSPYALVGQGELDLVITGRPEDRGAMVEEVGGLSRVRERLSSMKRRMARLQPLGHRVADALGEMEGRLEPLRIQAGRALEHEQVTERLRELERALQLHRLARLRNDARGHRSACQRLEERLAEGRQQLALDQKGVMDSKLLSQEAARELGEAQRRASRSRENLHLARHQIQQSQDRGAGLSREAGRLRADIEDSWNRWQKITGDRRQAVSQEVEMAQGLFRIQEDLNAAQVRVSTLAGQLKSDSVGARNAKEELDAGRKEIRRLELEAARFGHRVTSTEGDLARSARQLDRVSHESKDLAQQKEHLEAEIERLASETESISRQVSELKDEQDQGRLALDENQRQSESVEKERSSVLARMDALTEMENLGAGYGEGTRFLMGLLESPGGPDLPGVLGTLGDLVRPLPGYEDILQAVLGPSATDLLAVSRKSAREGIGRLRESRAGRATFWLEDASLPPFSPPPGYSDLPGLVAVGRDIIDPESPGFDLGAALLSDVLVFESLEYVPGAREMEAWGIRAVTRDGDVVFPGGLSGGSRDEGIWTRRRDITQLGLELEKLDENLARLRAKHAGIRARQEALSSDLTELGLTQRTLAVTGQHTGDLLSDCRRRLSDAHKQKASIVARVARMERDLTRDRARLDDLTGSRAEIEQTLGALEQRLREETGVREKIREDLDRAREKMAGIQADLESRRARLDVTRSWNQRLTTDLIDLARMRGRNLGSLSETLENMERESSRCHDMELKTAALDESLDGERQRLEELEAAVRAREEEARSAEAAVSKASERLSRLENRLHREELTLARLTTELDGVTQLLRERGVTDEDMEGAASLDDPEGVASQAGELRHRIRSLGVVNPLAVDECARLEERYGRMKAAWDDISAATGDFDWIRASLERAMRRVFMDVLAQLDARFTSAFVQLFGGGEARLLLSGSGEDDEIPGIDMVAQPPGKKLQHLSLLSGGERALTAIAFLFALLDLRPAPFVVLDEIDAALDEHNVKRFAGYLRELSSRTQVIIVTHQRGTMEGADMLYGTTMDDSGVTQVVPARLSELEAAGHV